MKRWAVVLVTAMVGCGGRVEDLAEVPVHDHFIHDRVETLPASGPGVIDSVSISCETGTVFVRGGCEVSAGASLVQDDAFGGGWECGVVTDRDNVRVRVWVECAR